MVYIFTLKIVNKTPGGFRFKSWNDNNISCSSNLQYLNSKSVVYCR